MKATRIYFISINLSFSYLFCILPSMYYHDSIIMYVLVYYPWSRTVFVTDDVGIGTQVEIMLLLYYNAIIALIRGKKINGLENPYF